VYVAKYSVCVGKSIRKDSGAEREMASKIDRDWSWFRLSSKRGKDKSAGGCERKSGVWGEAIGEKKRGPQNVSTVVQRTQ